MPLIHLVAAVTRHVQQSPPVWPVAFRLLVQDPVLSLCHMLPDQRDCCEICPIAISARVDCMRDRIPAVTVLRCRCLKARATHERLQCTSVPIVI